MASKEELSEQLAVTQKLAAAVDMMARSMSRVETSFDNQISAVEKLTRAIETLKGQDLSQLNSTKLSNVQKEFKATEKQVTGLSGRIKDLGNQMSKKFPSAAATGAAALSGFIQGIRNLAAMGKSVTGFFASFIDGVTNIAASIIAIPFKMFNALIDMAAGAGAGMNELAQAIENLRKEMGDLKGPGASAVMETSKTLQGFADTGLSAYRVFGTLAERLELVTKVAVAMGATFGMLTQEFKENGGALLAFQKGLGVSEEGMKAIGDRAITMGKPMTKVFLDMTKQTLALGKAFDIDQKLIGKDMVKAMQNVKHFGALTVKEIAQASVYARKLGLELDKITGTLDAFETFDSAAENAAKLSQAFGVNIDAFKMMEAQNPAEQLDMLRKSFRDAGIDASKFTRQQAKLLAQTTNLDEATVRQALSAENYGVSLQDVKKNSEAAEKKTLTQADAMSKLADSIERMVKSGGGQEGGFWQMFVKGFLGGIQASKEFREIIWNIKKSLQLVYYEGVRLGKAFVEMFPGVKMFLQGIADFFRPEKFKRLVGGVVDILKDWMKDLQDPNGKASFSGLMDKLKKKFFDFFDGQSGSGKKMLEGFKTFAKTITKVVAEAIKWAADKVGEGLQLIIDLVTGKKQLGDTSAAGDALGFLGEILAPLGDALAHAWKAIAPKLWELVKTLGSKLFDYLTSKEFIDLVKPAMPYMAAALFGPAFGRALLGAGVSALGNAAIKLFTSGSTKKIMEDVATKAASQVMEASNKVASKGGGAGAAGMQQVGAVNKAAGEATRPTGAKDWGVKDAVKLGLKLVAIAVALGVGGVAMALAIVGMKKILDSGGITGVNDIIGPLLLLGAMVLAAIPLMLAMKVAANVGSMGDILKGGLIISVAVGLVGVVGAGIAYLLKQVANPAQLSAASDLMMKMSLVFLAMIPLIFASMAIGALASGPQAVALAAAAVGLGIVGVAVAEMAGISMEIVKEVAKLKIDATFQRKIDAFLGVMKAIQAFADTLVKLIDLMTPSFGEIISGKAESFTEKVDAARGLLAQMIGARGGKTGLIGIIETVMDSVKKLNIGGPEMVEAANVFSNVMQAVTGFMQAAAPPEAFFTEGGSFINKLIDPSHNFQSLATDVGHYATLMREGAMMMLTGKPDGSGKDGVLGIIEKMARMSVPSPENAGAIANLLSSTAGVLKALVPSPETMKAFQTTTEGSAFWGLAKTKVEKLDTGAIKTTIETMGSALQDILPTLVNDVLGRVIDQSKGLDKNQIENIKVMADIIASVSNIAGGLASAAQGKEVTPVEVAGAVHWATKEAPNLGELFKSVGEHLPGLFESIIKLVSGINVDKSLAKKLEDAKNIFGFIAEIPKLAQSISSTHGKDGGDVRNIEPMIDSISAMTTFMGRLVADYGRNPIKDLMNNIKEVGDTIQKSGGDKTLKIVDVVKNLFGGLSAMGTSLKQVTTLASVDPVQVGLAVSQIVEAVGRTIDPLSKVSSTLTPDVMKQVSTSISQIKVYADQVNKLTNVVKSEGIATALTAASEMIKRANDLDKALSDGIKIDTPAKLTKLAQSVGLGSKTNYTIRSKDVVLTVNLNVTMNVDEVEKVMIMRTKSIIRDRINFATGDGAGEKGTPQIPETYQSAIPNIQKSG